MGFVLGATKGGVPTHKWFVLVGKLLSLVRQKASQRNRGLTTFTWFRLVAVWKTKTKALQDERL
jgi:hypothetical protein